MTPSKSAEAVWALQRGLVAVLRADAALKAALADPVPVYDAPPGTGGMPYLVLGDWSFTDAGTDDQPGVSHLFTIEIWSDYAGRKTALDIAAKIEAALAALGPALDGHTLVNLRTAGGRFVRQESERLTLGALRFAAFTHPNS